MGKDINILGLDQDALSNLKGNAINRLLTTEEIFHIFNLLGNLWFYDYKAAEQGRVGMHAELKSGKHSDGFINAKASLEIENINQIFAWQFIFKCAELTKKGFDMRADRTIGIPDAATELAHYFAQRMFLRKWGGLIKVNGVMMLDIANPISSDEKILLFEDICTTGKGFSEAVRLLRPVGESKPTPRSRIIPLELVIVERGGVDRINVDGEEFLVVPLARKKLTDWDNREACELCKMGSVPIKPKATPENWKAITTSQL